MKGKVHQRADGTQIQKTVRKTTPPYSNPFRSTAKWIEWPGELTVERMTGRWEKKAAGGSTSDPQT